MKKVYLLLSFLIIGSFTGCGKTAAPKDNYDAIKELKIRAEQGDEELKNINQ
jgi:hypothetical protein